MNLLFVLEIILVVGGIALVPARSQLRICRPREIYNERERQNSLRSQLLTSESTPNRWRWL
jgi:hypothetical protein